MQYPIRFDSGKGASAMHMVNSDWQDVPFWRIVHVTEGKGSYLCKDLQVEACEGDFFLIGPGKRSILVEDSFRLTYLPFTFDGNIDLDIVSLPLIRFDGSGHDLLTLEHAFIDIQRELNRDTSSSRAALQVQLILHLFEDAQQALSHTTPVGIREAALQLTTHPEKRLSMSSLAEKAGYSIAQFNRLFRDSYNTSPARYAIRTRMEAACRLLSTEGLSVKETAYSLNYSSPYAFSRQFKEERGCPPGKYK